jgi:hypothetical protein
MNVSAKGPPAEELQPERAARAARTYGAAADHYLLPMLGFWDAWGVATIARLPLHELERADDFWDIALGSGYRATVDALRDEQLEQLRERVIGELRARSVSRLRNDVVFGSAAKG